MAAFFDGVDDKLECADESAFDWEKTSPISMGAWVLKTTNSGECVCGKASVSGFTGYVLNTEPGTNGLRLSLHLVNTGGTHLFVESPDCWLPNFWVRLDATYDGSITVAGVKLHLNGTDQGAGTTLNDLVGSLLNDNPFRVAGHETGGGEFWLGAACGVVADNAQWTAPELTKLADLANFYRAPAEYLTAAPELWLPLFAKPSNSAFDLNDYANNHDATIVGAPTVQGDPEVILDWPSSGIGATTQSFTSTTSFTHTPSPAGLKGVLVCVAQTAVSTDLVPSATYGGVAMQRVAIAQDAVTEAGVVYVFFLGSGVPAGAQTVGITVSSGTDAKEAWVIGLLSAGDVRVVASARQQDDAANPSVTLATTPNFSGLVFNVLYSGLPNTTDIVAATGYTELGANRDFGVNVAGCCGGNKAGANITSGWTSAIDDVAMISVAVGPVPKNREKRNAPELVYLRRNR